MKRLWFYNYLCFIGMELIISLGYCVHLGIDKLRQIIKFRNVFGWTHNSLFRLLSIAHIYWLVVNGFVHYKQRLEGVVIWIISLSWVESPIHIRAKHVVTQTENECADEISQQQADPQNTLKNEMEDVYEDQPAQRERGDFFIALSLSVSRTGTIYVHCLCHPYFIFLSPFGIW